MAASAGIIAAGPVKAVATFAECLIAGLRGALICTVAVFPPSFLLVLLVAPLLLRHRARRNVRGFLIEVYGAEVLLGRAATG